MVLKDGIPRWVMPTLFVTRPDKPGKVRVCQDAKAKVKGVSLNDNLLTGPDLANSLLGILFRFRRHKVVVSADIEGFFHNIYYVAHKKRTIFNCHLIIHPLRKK